MKNTITLLFLSLIFSISSLFGQRTAPDFTVKDIEGNEYNLYSILDEGKVVILDVSTTWCSACWQIHQAKHLNRLAEKYGPTGTNQVVVLFYEADESTGEAQLNGTGPRTLGDWVTGSNYPIINENPISIDLDVWAPIGFPTINVISTEKKIVGDLFDHQNSMEEFLAPYLKTPTSVENTQLATMRISPNPASDMVHINFDVEGPSISHVTITSMDGKKVLSQNVRGDKVALAIDHLSTGTYVTNLYSNNLLIKSQRFIKK